MDDMRRAAKQHAAFSKQKVVEYIEAHPDFNGDVQEFAESHRIAAEMVGYDEDMRVAVEFRCDNDVIGTAVLQWSDDPVWYEGDTCDLTQFPNALPFGLGEEFFVSNEDSELKEPLTKAQAREMVERCRKEINRYVETYCAEYIPDMPDGGVNFRAHITPTGFDKCLVILLKDDDTTIGAATLTWPDKVEWHLPSEVDQIALENLLKTGKSVHCGAAPRQRDLPCPYCGTDIRGIKVFSADEENANRRPVGATAICASCHSVVVVTEIGVRLGTQDDVDCTMPEMWSAMLEVAGVEPIVRHKDDIRRN